ncbi:MULTISPECIES: glycine-rich domain-containing protein [Neptunomonas]|uniref:Glycine-rich domain-containing protein n=1 Tax=Neptunomonas marina TaxID=1815562 RepID=A0A437QDU1_9GAMM|nr:MULTISPECIES: hypothetical protein [Neptunomonas]RVU32720.1 hypothetical protein EOE65_03430 [Neptunomonas marina]
MRERVEVFDTSALWTVPNRVFAARLTLVAGGGGGARNEHEYGIAAYGGSGAYIVDLPISLTPGEVVDIQVGDAGISNSESPGFSNINVSGVDGSNSSVTTQAKTFTVFGGKAGRVRMSTSPKVGIDGDGGEPNGIDGESGKKIVTPVHRYGFGGSPSVQPGAGVAILSWLEEAS